MGERRCLCQGTASSRDRIGMCFYCRSTGSKTPGTSFSGPAFHKSQKNTQWGHGAPPVGAGEHGSHVTPIFTKPGGSPGPALFPYWQVYPSCEEHLMCADCWGLEVAGSGGLCSVGGVLGSLQGFYSETSTQNKNKKGASCGCSSLYCQLLGK